MHYQARYVAFCDLLGPFQYCDLGGGQQLLISTAGFAKEERTTGTKLNMLAANRKGPMTCPTMLLVDRDGWGKAFRRMLHSDRACPAREYCCRAISLSVATCRGRLNRFKLS